VLFRSTPRVLVVNALTPTALGFNIIGTGNTAVGANALQKNTVAFNTAVGVNALTTNTLGVSNTAVGANSLASNLIGESNTALGDRALFLNDSLGFNIAIGANAASASITGTNNIAIGSFALEINESTSNIAIGRGAASGSATGTGNIAIGTAALAANDSAGNIAIGSAALAGSAGGTGNIAIGSSALAINEGAGNIAIGVGAFSSFVGGANCIAIGTGAGDLSPVGLDNIWIGSPGFPTIATIGIGTPGEHLSCFIQGIFTFPNPSPLLVNVNPLGQLGFFVPIPSSKKYKHDIEDMGVDSEIIYKLRPVTFKYNADDAIGYGLIAEESDEVFPYLTTMHWERQDEIYSVDYAKLPALLLNEVQKINKSVNELKEKDLTIEDLRADNQAMKKIISDLLVRIQKLEKQRA
jgi:trimeric autotransporter adhesin